MGLLDLFMGSGDPATTGSLPSPALAPDDGASFFQRYLYPDDMSRGTSSRLDATFGALGAGLLAGNSRQLINPQAFAASLDASSKEMDQQRQRAALKMILKQSNPNLSDAQLEAMANDPQTAKLAMSGFEAQASAKAGQQASGILSGLFGGDAPAQPGAAPGGAGGNATPFSGSQAERAKTIYDGVIARGGSPMLASAAVGNFTGESDLNPSIGGDKDRAGNPTSFGLGQWRGERLDALKALAAKQGKSWQDPDVQLDHMMAELNGGDAGAVRANRLIQSAQTPEQAAAIFAKHFERPSDEAYASSLPKRAGAAAYAFGAFGNGPKAVQVADASGAMPAMPEAPGRAPMPGLPVVSSYAPGFNPNGPDPLAGFQPSAEPYASAPAPQTVPRVGAGGTPPPPPAPAPLPGTRNASGGVRVAENERQVQELEGRMSMLPPSVYGVTQTAQAGNPLADMPAADAQNADFIIPPGSLVAGGRSYGPETTTGRSIERNINRQLERGPLPPSSYGFPLNDPAKAAAAIPKLMQVLAIPNLPDAQKAQTKSILDYALGVVKPSDNSRRLIESGYVPGSQEYIDASRRQLSDNRPSTVQEYEYSRSNPDFDAYRDRRSAKAEPQISAQVAQRREAAESLGLVPGSPGYQSYALTGKMPNEDKPGPSAGDKKVIQNAEDELPTIDNAIVSLTRAKELNPQTYTGATAKYYAAIGTSGVPGAGLIADTTKAGKTREFNQLMSMEAISAMSKTLKGATTDAEMARFMEILGDPSTPPDIRGRTIDKLLTLAQRQRETAVSRLNELREGTYYNRRESSGGPSSGAPRSAPTPSASPPAAAVNLLRQNPRLRADFDAKYGAGAADAALGGR